MSDKSLHRPLYAVLGLVITALLALAVIALSDTTLRGVRLDLTEHRIYTLSPGTRAILSKIDEPIHLYFFYSRGLAQSYPSVSTYAQRVQDMLEEMAQIAGDKVQLSLIDPEPFSEEEDRAVQLGIKRIPLGSTGETLFFGLAGTNAVGQTEAIPYFSRQREALLEYDIAKLIYQLSQDHKPVVGLISGLEMGGGVDPGSMRVRTAWVVLEQLRQLFELRDLEQDLEEIPEDVALLMLVHPTELTPQARYAIDQFVLGGGHVLVFLDPYADAATLPSMMGARPQEGSYLPVLLKAWGARMREDEVVGDAYYALRATTDPAKAPIRDYTTIGVRSPGLNEEDIITRGLEQIDLAYAGILEPVEGSDVTFSPLIESSDQAMPIPVSRIHPGLDPAALQRGFRPTGRHYVLAARLTGKAHTAFPDGPPPAQADDPPGPHAATEAAPDKDRGEAAPNEGPDSPAETQKSGHLAESKSPINVVVVADTDLLSDRLWVTVDSFFGQRIATPFASNGDLVTNAVDNLLGSDDLISIRARASFSRPFTRVEALRIEAEGRLREQEEALKARLAETEKRLKALQSQKGPDDSLILSDEQRKAIHQLEQDVLQTRKALRAVQHDLNRNIERLGSVLKFLNIVLVPLLLTIALAVFVWRRRHRHPQRHREGTP